LNHLQKSFFFKDFLELLFGQKKENPGKNVLAIVDKAHGHQHHQNILGKKDLKK
jgi:hypothetical protein